MSASPLLGDLPGGCGYGGGAPVVLTPGFAGVQVCAEGLPAAVEGVPAGGPPAAAGLTASFCSGAPHRQLFRRNDSSL